MSPRRLIPALAALVLVPLLASAAPAPRPHAPVQDGPVDRAPEVLPYAPDRLLVRFTPEALAAARLDDPAAKAALRERTGLPRLDAALAAAGVTRLERAHPHVADGARAARLGVDRWYVLTLSAGADVPAAARRLADDPALEYALPDLRAFPAVTPNDPLYADHWGHDNTAQLPDLDWGGTYEHTLPTTVGTVGFDADADLAWDGAQGYGDSGVVIAILDSGVDSTHPDLVQVAGYDYGDGDPDAHDDSASPGHGTACAGVAAAVADNGLGAVGVAGGCSIMPLKVADAAGSLYFSYIIDAVYHAADNGADVISMSFGASAFAYAPMDDAVAYADGLGVVLLAATGNENDSTIGYPAYNPLVIGVGAASPCGDRKRSSSSSGEVNPGVSTDPNGYTCDGERWWGSNYGSTIQDHQGAVDVIAPTILPTTDIQGAAGYDAGDYSGFFNGTSCATPYAAGVCALIRSANPGWTPAQVRAQLVGTAQDIVNVESGPGWDRYTGYGMVDAAAAVGISGPAAPVADFSASPTAGCAPLAVAFTDLSTGDVDAWSWDFGDGGTASVADPGHDYAAPGTYDVTLIASGPGGADTLTVAALVTVDGPPVASFDSSLPTVTVGGTVVFTDESTGAPTAWSWDFGDGGTSTLQDPDHVYTAPGTYSVTLIAANACGPDTVTAADLVTVSPPDPPVADFEAAPTAGCAPLTVAFTDLSGPAVDTWSWDFGDGATADVADPSHEYTAPGTYDVTLVVANAGGADTLTAAGLVTVEGPPAAAFVPSATGVTAGDPVTFTDQSTGAPTSWSWDFGDGATAATQDPVHAYTAAGLYTVTLVAANACGPDTVVAVDLVDVAPPAAPVAAFTAAGALGCAPLEVTFTDQSAGAIDTWHWDFDDGATSDAQHPVHTFADPGGYTVTLIVAGAGGADTLTVPGAALVDPVPAAAFTVSDTLGAPPLTVTFTHQATGTPRTWLWDFGDGATDSVASPVHTYTADGIFDVTLIVGNACASDTFTMIAAVQASGLSASGEPVPAGFGLAGIYPNPFNPMTTIVFGMKDAGRARLEVYDVSGRRVATVVDEHRDAGTHRVAWRPRGLASGVYFARLTAHGQSAVQRVTLLK